MVEFTRVCVDDSENVASVRVKGPIDFAHGIRGMILDEIDTLAITTIIPMGPSEKLDLFMPINVLLDRLSQVPLRLCMNPGERASSHMTPFTTCECGELLGCNKCTRRLSLCVTNSLCVPMMVTSISLKPVVSEEGPQIEVAHTETPSEAVHAVEVGPPRDRLLHEMDDTYGAGIHLLTLGPGQAVDLVCVATLGKNSMHAKWSAVSTVTLKQKVGIAICPEEVQAIHPDAFTMLLEEASSIVTGEILSSGVQQMYVQPGGEWGVDDPLRIREVLKIFGRQLQDIDFVGKEGLVVDPPLPVSISPLSEFEISAECVGSVNPWDLILCTVNTVQEQGLSFFDDLLTTLDKQRTSILKGMGSMA